MDITKNTGDILGKLQTGLGPEVGDELIKKVANPLQGFLRQSLQKDFKNVQPRKTLESAKIPVVKNDGEKNVAALKNEVINAFDQTGFFGGKTVEPTAEKPTVETSKPGFTK